MTLDERVNLARKEGILDMAGTSRTFGLAVFDLREIPRHERQQSPIDKFAPVQPVGSPLRIDRTFGE